MNITTKDVENREKTGNYLWFQDNGYSEVPTHRLSDVTVSKRWHSLNASARKIGGRTMLRYTGTMIGAVSKLNQDPYTF